MCVKYVHSYKILLLELPGFFVCNGALKISGIRKPLIHFLVIILDCPMYCCKQDTSCPIMYATSLADPVPGCRGKIETYAKYYMQKVMIILIIAVCLQVSSDITILYSLINVKLASKMGALTFIRDGIQLL